MFDLKPGSKEAVAEGCSCPIIDNHYGAGRPTSNGVEYWMTADCGLHGHINEPDEDEQEQE